MRQASKQNLKHIILSIQRIKRFVLILIISLIVLSGGFDLSATSASGPSSNRLLNYQIRLTDISGNLISDGTYNLKLTVYDASSGGNQLYTVCSADGSATGTPTAVQVSMFSGVGSILIGDTSNVCASGSAVAMPATLFNNTLMYLGVTVGTDSEMTPRKRIVGTGYAMNADRLDDLETSYNGGTAAYVPVTDSNGNLTLTGNPQGSGVAQGTLTINPATADANEALFGVALGGSSRFVVDEDGDAAISRSLAIGASSTSAMFDVLGSFSADSGTTNNVAELRLTTPVDTSGTNIHQLLNIDAEIGASSGGNNTVNLIAIDALTGSAYVALNAFNLGTLTGSVAEEVAFRIGEGWDATFKSEQTATGGTDIAFSFDTENDLADADTLVSFKEQGTQKARIKADGSFVVGSASTTYGDGLIESSGALAINTNGQDVGIGTAPSSVKLHVFDTDAGTSSLLSILRLDRQTSGTAAAGLGVSMDWFLEDAAGNSDQASRIDVLWDDATNNSEDAHLSFSLADGGALTEVARMDDDGYFGVKTLGAATANDLCYDTTTISGLYALTACSGSSQRFKENIEDLVVDIDKVLSLRPVNFDWKDQWVPDGEGGFRNMKQSGPSVGLIAEEVAALIPEIVKYDSNGLISGLEYKLLSVYELAVLKQHHTELSRALKLAENSGSAYIISPNETGATEEQLTFNSKEISFQGSVKRNETMEEKVLEFSLRNTIESADNSRLSILNDEQVEIAYFGQNGDLAIKRRLYLMSESDPQTSRYIFYDDSTGPGGDFIRTNAAGWSTSQNDFAEMFASDDNLEAGELVMLDTGSALKVKRANNEHETNGYLLSGIVSTRPGFLAGVNEAYSYPIALQGRVPARVNTENGPILIGDPIAISSEPGVGMRATQPSYVVGIALENYSGSEDEEDSLIVVFLKTGWYNGTDVEQPNVDISAKFGEIASYNNVLDMGGYPIIGIGALEGIDGLWSIDGSGKLTAKEVEAEDVQAGELTVKANDSKTTIGEGVVPNGSSNFVVENPAIRYNSRIFVTFFGNVEGNWWVAERTDGRFVIVLSKVATNDIPFEYWILDVVDERTSPSIEGDEDVLASVIVEAPIIDAILEESVDVEQEAPIESSDDDDDHPGQAAIEDVENIDVLPGEEIPIAE
jgi:hypothetical protein